MLEKDPNYFDKMFPYAIAFGLDNTFTQKFEHSEVSVPSWYIMDAMYHQHHHTPVTAFSHFSSEFRPTEIKQVFNSSPTPSDSGSGSGGSFSGGAGGGFGGGGGSSW